jgi:hypothetical protein
MQDLDLPKGNLIMHKIQINLGVLCSLMLDRVTSQILRTALSQNTRVAF